ncbi:MAG: hypothetical protein ACOYOP_09490 [Microthrixaceae bacterium]
MTTQGDTVQHPVSGRAGTTRSVRPAALLAALAVVAVVAAACVAPPAPTTTTTSTTTTTTLVPANRGALCKVWDQRFKVDDKGVPITPQRPFVYALDRNTVLQSRGEVIQRGGSCTDKDASLNFQTAEIIGADLYLPVGNSADGPQLKPVPFSPTLAPGQAQAPNVEILSLGVELTSNGIRIYGSIRVTAAGAVSTLSFDGTFLDLENFSVTVSGRLDLPGVAADPLSVTGSFVRSAGINSFTFDAQVPGLQVGDVQIENARVLLTATTTTGLHLLVQGQVRVQQNQVAVRLEADLDVDGNIRNVDGFIDVSLSGVQPDGSVAALDGRVTLRGDATGISASFLGSGSFGPDGVARAAGSASVDAAGIVTLDGLFEVDKGGTVLSLRGSLRFDPTSATPNLRAVAQGSFTGVTDIGEIVEVSGQITTTVVGSTVTTTVDGSLRVGNLIGRGSALVESTRRTTSLAFTGRIETGGLAAEADGTITITDGVLESLSLTGSIIVGDVGKGTLSGSLAVSGDQTGVRLAVDGRFQAEGADVSGRLSLALDNAGVLRSLRGNVGGTLTDGARSVGSFNGLVVVDDNGLRATGSGVLFAPGVVAAAVSGSLVVDPAVGPVLNLQGQALLSSGSKRLFGDISVVNNELTMLRAGMVYPPIFPGIENERLWIRIRQGAAGNCVNFQLLESTFLIGLFNNWRIALLDLACPG